MATNPRTKNPNDAALSAVEEALRLDYEPGADSTAEPERAPRQRRPEPPRPDAARRSEMLRRPEAPRTPAPPRRGEQAAPRPRAERVERRPDPVEDPRWDEAAPRCEAGEIAA